MEEIVPNRPTVGQMWQSPDGKSVHVTGYRSGGRLVVTGLAVNGPDGASEVVLNLDGYRYVSCDHVTYCCWAHDVHTSPHQGCMLR